MAALYVGDLHPEVTELMIFERFRPAGPIKSVHICRDRKSGYSLGYAYVNFCYQYDAERALEMFNFELLLEKPMRVMWSRFERTLNWTNGSNIIIKNLDKSIQSVDLFDTFSVFGKIVSCKVVESKGYGYVQFESQEAAASAIKRLNGMLLNDQYVTIEYFKYRDERKPEARPQDQANNLFIKNLDYTIDDECLRTVFGEFGTIISAKVTYILRQTDRQTRPQHQANNLFIKNLDYTIDDECLRTVFGEFGTIISAKVMTENGLSKGFGFVSFTSSQEAMTAKKALNGRMWGKKQVYVGVALRKEERQAQLKNEKAQKMLNLQNNVPHPSIMTAPSEAPGFETAFFEDIVPGFETARFEDIVPGFETAPLVDTFPGFETAPLVDTFPGFETAPSEDSVPVFETVTPEDIFPDFKTAPAVERAPAEAPAALSDTTKATAAVEELSTSVANVDAVQLEDRTKDAPTSTPSGKRLTIYMLESAPPDDRIQMAYDYMLPLVKKIHPSLASKITWMLIEGENNFEIINMIRVPELLRARVHEMDSLLKAREAGHKPETLKMMYRHKTSRNRKKKNNKNKNKRNI
ncbi:polyadenylate-binding protein 1-like [Tachysurus fulvidraco]|uniref:polyadenylate-binding protein 1-like n=1 Tax=Tachysurus fulvidraco TaxID=1234273 RepID=UPI001FF050FD|nr:polyadenylate-binding protein 1-like [Tachysurus fulvidraco]